ncbi:HAD family hydrolase [Streptomyces beihaiensis]|uniref:HAD-IA family hydrolase n=1 Tax=Streptomyces beihaiensis TaxID=2984495 RepID=A0ABT3TS70_9ACTN|nr:HAD-IA family hydrolase [Streptomyces beihaiensis]MCX3059884.1 HAD-IA family hydrolase [Streptomyces beihaiensis]
MGERDSALVAPLRGVRAVVFDTDGVLTDSARLHAQAWKTVFDEYLRDHPPAAAADRRPFAVATDYPSLVDGKARLDGAEAFLASRGLHPGPEAVAAVAAEKDAVYRARLTAGPPVRACPGAVPLLRALRAAKVPAAAASASRHARQVLGGADLLTWFDAVVDGVEAARLALPGKPAPDLFLETARRLGVAPGEAAVVEDAPAGVAAARRGGFRLVVGVDRTQDRSRTGELMDQGADLVVGTLDELLAQGAPR